MAPVNEMTEDRVCSRCGELFSIRTLFREMAGREIAKIVYCSGLANGGEAFKFRRMSMMSPTALVRVQFEKVSSYERIPTC